MSTKITFNGIEYQRPEDMPPAVREAYEKAIAMANTGGPWGSLFPKVNVKVSTKVRLVHDGKTYESIDQMPPEVREQYQKALDQVDKDHNGVPDFLEGGSASSPAAPTASDEAFAASAPLVPQPPVIAPERSSNGLLVAAAGIILLLLIVIAGLALYILLLPH